MFSVDTISGLLYYIRVVKRNDARASGSAVEHHLAKVGVAGSIPVSRSREGSGSPAEAVRGFSLCAEPRGKRSPAEAVRGFSLCAEGLFFMRRTERQKIACRGGSGLFFMRRTERQKIREVKETGATVCLVVPAFPFLADPRFDFARPGVSCFHDPGEAVCRPRCKRPVRPLTRSLPLSRGYSTSCPHPRPDSGRLPVRCISRGRGRGTDCSGFPHPSGPSPRCWALSSRCTRNS